MDIVPPAEYQRDPYPFYATMRRDHPVAYDERSGFWAVYRYDDVRHVITDHDTFSSDRTRMLTGADPEMTERVRVGSSLVGTDPPRHRLLRDLVSRAFTPRAIAQLEPHIAELTEAMLDAVVPAGRMDLIVDLAYPLPVTVIAEMLGVPPSDRPTFKSWADALVSGTNEIPTDANSPIVKERMRLLQEMNDYFRAVVDQRRIAPRDDLVSRLVAAEVEGQRLADAEVLAFCTVLLVAGHITTTNLLGNAMLALLDHRDQLARLQADLALVPSAVEEALRYDGPVQAIARFVVRDADVGGQHIAAGGRILAWTAAANRDEAVFAAPDRFDVERAPNPHLAFGAGIHFCLGAPLARLEAAIALEEIGRRLPELRRADEAPLEQVPGFIMHGVKHLPLRFTPA